MNVIYAKKHEEIHILKLLSLQNYNKQKYINKSSLMRTLVTFLHKFSSK